MLPVGFLGAKPANSGIQRDVKKARQLIAEAGDGAAVDLIYPEITWFGVDMAVMAQKVHADLTEAGLKVNLAPTELPALFEMMSQGKTPLLLLAWGPDYPDPLDYLALCASIVIQAIPVDLASANLGQQARYMPRSLSHSGRGGFGRMK
jgi:ABC-type transport system substrate-binding protein